MKNLHQKINETKVALGMDNKRLSLALDHHRNYIARVLKNEHSDKFDQNLIKQLDDLIESKKIKINELPAFVLSKDQCNSCRDAFIKDNDDLKKQLEESKHYYLKVVDDCRNLINASNDLKNQLEYKTELLARKDDEISSLKTDLEKHKVWLEIESAYSDGTDKTISKLKKEIDIQKKNYELLNSEYSKIVDDFCEYKNKSNVNKVLISLFLFACFSVGLTYILLNH